MQIYGRASRSSAHAYAAVGDQARPFCAQGRDRRRFAVCRYARLSRRVPCRSIHHDSAAVYDHAYSVVLLSCVPRLGIHAYMLRRERVRNTLVRHTRIRHAARRVRARQRDNVYLAAALAENAAASVRSYLRRHVRRAVLRFLPHIHASSICFSRRCS